MDAAWKQMMETNVGEYITKVDFKNPDFSGAILELQQKFETIY